MTQVDTGLIGPCQLWPGAKTVAGYGRKMINRRIIYAHRLAFCQANNLSIDEIDGLVIRHKCDNPACTNPAHLETGSQADNLRDMWARGRGKCTPSPGEVNGNHKLTEAEVREIRRIFKKRCKVFGGAALARRFNVDKTQVHNIVNGKQWKHLLGETHAS